jgi:hypothetical protein
MRAICRASCQASAEAGPTRVSRRKRGEAADPEDDAAGEGGAPRAAQPHNGGGADDDGHAAAAPPGPRARVPFPEPDPRITVLAPFTLLSIGCVYVAVALDRSACALTRICALFRSAV